MFAKPLNTRLPKNYFSLCKKQTKNNRIIYTLGFFSVWRFHLYFESNVQIHGALTENVHIRPAVILSPVMNRVFLSKELLLACYLNWNIPHQIPIYLVMWHGLHLRNTHWNHHILNWTAKDDKQRSVTLVPLLDEASIGSVISKNTKKWIPGCSLIENHIYCPPPPSLSSIEHTMGDTNNHVQDMSPIEAVRDFSVNP